MASMPPFTHDPNVERLEAAYARYLEAWGAWMVGHHRGIGNSAEERLASALVETRGALSSVVASGRWDDLGADDAAAVRTLRACLPDLDAWAQPLDGRVFADSPGDAGTRQATERDGPDPVATLRRTTFDAWGQAMAELTVGSDAFDRLTVTSMLAREDDETRRRALFLSMEPAWRSLNGDDETNSPYRRLLVASAALWTREGSPIDANALALGMDPVSVEPTMRRILRAFRTVAIGPGLVEPWDYRHRIGGLARQLDPLVPIDRLRKINDAHLRSIGADPAALNIGYDIHPRGDRPVIPTAFTVTEGIAVRDADGTWTSARPWVFATYAQGGIGNLEELLHESGHALHYAAIRTRPAMFSWPPDQTAFVEAIADVVGWTTHEPAFLREHLGVEITRRESVITRFGGVAMDAAWTLFELELHRHPDRSPNQVWAEIAERDLGIRGHPEWSWWAGRGQLSDGPGYLANYALGAIVVAAVRARVRATRGDWSVGDPGWYRHLSEALLQDGGGRAPRSLLTAYLNGPLTAESLIANIEEAG